MKRGGAWPAAADILFRSKSLLSNRMHRLCGQERYDPFFIVGCERSGTTLLRRVLQAGGEVHIPPETYVLGKAIETYREHRTARWPTLVRLVLSLFEFHPRFEDFGVRLGPLARDLYEAPHEKRNLAYLLNALFTYHATQHGVDVRRWGDKTPLNRDSLESIVSVFPDARFVHVIRDGADVIYSLVDAGIFEDVETAARHWRDAVARTHDFAARNPERVFELRYEEMVTDSERVIGELCAFLGVTFSPAMLDRRDHVSSLGDVPAIAHHKNIYRPITRASIGKGRGRISHAAAAPLGRIMDHELTRLDYQPVGTGVS